MDATKGLLKGTVIVILIVGILLGIIYGASWIGDQAKLASHSLASTHEEYNGFTPKMEKISNNPDDVDWTYYVDHTTNSIYLVKETTYQFGISPVLNSDGTPMTLEQLADSRGIMEGGSR